MHRGGPQLNLTIDGWVIHYIPSCICPGIYGLRSVFGETWRTDQPLPHSYSLLRVHRHLYRTPKDSQEEYDAQRTCHYGLTVRATERGFHHVESVTNKRYWEQLKYDRKEGPAITTAKLETEKTLSSLSNSRNFPDSVQVHRPFRVCMQQVASRGVATFRRLYAIEMHWSLKFNCHHKSQVNCPHIQQKSSKIRAFCC